MDGVSPVPVIVSHVPIKDNVCKRIRRRKRWGDMVSETDDHDELEQAVDGSDKVHMYVGFQVADVTKPRIAVKRIVKKGNMLRFGPKDEGCVTHSPKIGDRMILKPNGRGPI